MNDDLTHHRLCVPTLFAWGSIIEPPTKHSSSGVCVFALWNSSSRVDRERENSVSHGQTQGQKKKGRKQNVLMRQVVLFIVNENEPAEASESTQRDFHSWLGCPVYHGVL